MRKYFLQIFLISIIGLLIYSCTNPFAPKLADADNNTGLLGDQKTIAGIFQNFKYAYLFKDTVIYGKLLDDNFSFIFKNYDSDPVFEESWGRNEEMLTTYRLFNSAQNLDLIWSDVYSAFGDSLAMNISRGFQLSIVFSPIDIISLNGKVNLDITRKSTEEDWKILNWRDESNE